jgi:hypothetical protein
MRIFLLAIVCVFAFGCEKSDSDGSRGITGHWNMTEYMIDPGDGSGQWTPADSMASSAISFSADGKFSANNYFFSGYNRYSIENDSVLVFGSTTTNSSVSTRYSLKDSRLEIYPPCIEGCGFKFIYSGK